jgi:hypothetical protein
MAVKRIGGKNTLLAIFFHCLRSTHRPPPLRGFTFFEAPETGSPFARLLWHARLDPAVLEVEARLAQSCIPEAFDLADVEACAVVAKGSSRRGIIKARIVRLSGKGLANAHAQQVKDGYIAGVQGHRPAVISVNMFAASLAVNELLARLHPYREEANEEYGSVTFSLASMELMYGRHDEPCEMLEPFIGKGDMQPAAAPF